MAITQSQVDANRVRSQFASGAYLDSAATPEAMVFTLGFKPRYVKVVNETDMTIVEWHESLAATKSFKQAQNGDSTLATDSAIVVSDSGFTFLKALTIQNKQYRWMALA